MPEITTGLGIYVPYAEALGIRKVSEEPGHVRIELQLREEHMNSWHVAHGGIIMGLLDIAMGMSARALDAKSNGATTIELKTNFLQTATGRLTAEGVARRAGRSLVYVEGALTNAQGELIAKASGTFKLRYPSMERSSKT